MSSRFAEHPHVKLPRLEADRLCKRERPIAGHQGGTIRIAGNTPERNVVDPCANNHLGLAAGEAV